LEEVLALTDTTPPVHAGGIRAPLDRAARGLTLRALQEELHALAPAEPANRSGITRHQTLRRLGSRQPLCGIGVTSLMPTTSMPEFWMERIAVSRPEPGPFTITSTLRTPCSIARLATVSAASWAANGVLLREPLKPTLPAEAHASTLPCWSEIVMIVLLNEDLMCAMPCVMFLRSRRRGRRPPAWGFAIYLRAFFLPATVFFGPLRVRAFVRVR